MNTDTKQQAHKLWWFVTALLSLLLVQITGCASVPEGSTALTHQALSFTPPPGKAGVYVVRTYDCWESGTLYDVSLDYQEFGRLGMGSYLFGVVAPGVHSLRNTTPGFGGKSNIVTFVAEAGKNYFFATELGWVSFQLNQLSEADGQTYVRQRKLSGDNRFDYVRKPLS